MLGIKNSKAYFNLSKCGINCTFLFEVDKMNIYQKYSSCSYRTLKPTFQIRLPLILTEQMKINHN